MIVPGPHGSFALPQTIAELKRILRLDLETRDQSGSKRITGESRSTRKSGSPALTN
jgi:hypothetical protein